ncbi:transcriptional regulator [Nonomuraea sp. NPDC003707]
MSLLTSAGWARLRALLPGRAGLAAVGHRPRRDLLAGLTVTVVAVGDLASAEASTMPRYLSVLRGTGAVTATRADGVVLCPLSSGEMVKLLGAARRLLSEVFSDRSGLLAGLRRPPHQPRPG